MGPASIPEDAPSIHRREDGARIAYHLLPGRSPTVVFLGGFASHMGGTKASHLQRCCEARGQAYLRFDYQGHGASSGRFIDGTIGTWRDDAIAVIDGRTEGPLTLVGSSMGGWMMLLVALAMPRRVHSLLGIASAPDFTEELIWKRLSDDERRRLEADGILHTPSRYQEEPYPIAHGFVKEGRRHLLLDGSIPLECPVRLLHGLDDEDVPWQMSQRLLEALASADVTLELIKGGAHRLSEPHELERLSKCLVELLERSS
jgi:pimeloyl-ACP methyl ester carboxylesterase